MDIKDLITRCIRIIHISRKPTKEEFEQVAKITGLGIVVIGVLGLVISTVFSLI
jgi:protein transport protein SEC61 subunit gamma-like protein